MVLWAAACLVLVLWLLRAWCWRYGLLRACVGAQAAG